ncbi:MAG: hypothetical protein U0802_01495 [Candidatus Binatia bacterium]
MTDRSWTRGGLDDAGHAALRALPPSALWSAAAGAARRARRRARARQVLRQFERDGFVQPAPVDQRVLTVLGGHLLAAAARFEALELAPLAPLGARSTVGPTSQNKIVSALRGAEVLADPTNVLALECARRLRADARQVVRLATCQRCVRAQELPRQPGFAPHFRIFCLVSAGRERAEHALAVGELGEHIATHLAAFDRLEQHGYAFPDRRLTLLATPARAALADRVAAALAGVPVERGPREHAYYDGLRFQIATRSVEGDAVPLVDGGLFDWLPRLTSNRRLVMVASGMGAQLAAVRFRPRSAQRNTEEGSPP